MSRLTRRSLMQHSMGLLLTGGCASFPERGARSAGGSGTRTASTASAPEAAPSVVTEPGKPPHYIVQIVIHGGYDSVLTVDPKVPGASRFIDCEYTADEIVKGQRRTYGPLMSGLMRHESNLALVHGVRVDTVGHERATVSVARGRIEVGPSTPFIGDTIGGILPGTAPIPHLVIGGPFFFELVSTRGARSSAMYIPSGFTQERLVSPVVPAPPAWIKRMQQARAVEAAMLAGAPDRQSIERGWFEAEKLRGVLASADRRPSYDNMSFGTELNFAAQAIKGNLARYITVVGRFIVIDSHTRNRPHQTLVLPKAFNDIASFIDFLAKERNEFGPLIDQTTLIICSELGRFQKLNVADGKDHWPENSWMFLGPRFRKEPGGLTIGATDEHFRGVSVSYKTGAIKAPDARQITIDSVSATLLKLAGGDLVSHGFASDDVLDCLLA